MDANVSIKIKETIQAMVIKKLKVKCDTCKFDIHNKNQVNVDTVKKLKPSESLGTLIVLRNRKTYLYFMSKGSTFYA